MKVLIIRLSSIGDVILTTPIIRCLKASTSADIDFLTEETNLPVLRYNPNISTVLHPNHIETIDLNRYDHIIDLSNTRKSRKIHRRRHNSLILTDKMPIRKWLMLGARINLLNKSHTVDRHFSKLSKLSIINDNKGLDLHLSSKPRKIINHKIEGAIVINVGGSKLTKRIPKSLVEQIITSSERRFILLGGSDVAHDYNHFNYPNCINLVNAFSLSESFHVVSQCKLLITGDTALMHAAAALHKPQIVIWGSTSDDFGFAPYYGSDNVDQSTHIFKNLNCQPCSKAGKDHCPLGHMGCLSYIKVDEVLASIKSHCNAVKL